MKQSTLINHTNLKPDYNCTHLQAWLLGRHIEKWSLQNCLLFFRPPKLESVAVVPLVPNKDDDYFESEMFLPNGMCGAMPLNHYLRLSMPGVKGTFLVNAGFLLCKFVEDYKSGYKLLKEVMARARQEMATDSSDMITSIEGEDE